MNHHCEVAREGTTMVTKGGANKPLRMADPNSIFTALKAAKIKCEAKHNGNGNYRVELSSRLRQGVAPGERTDLFTK